MTIIQQNYDLCTETDSKVGVQLLKFDELAYCFSRYLEIDVIEIWHSHKSMPRVISLLQIEVQLQYM